MATMLTERKARNNTYQASQTSRKSDHLAWVDTTQQVAEIVTRSPPILPILLKCVSISAFHDIASQITPGDTVKLVRLQPVEIVMATVEYKSNSSQTMNAEYNGVALPSVISIPKSLDSITFEVVRGSVRYAITSMTMSFDEHASASASKSNSKTGGPVRFKSVQALSKQLPRFVKVIKTTKQIRQNTKIVEGHVLEIMGVHSPWATKDKFLSCRIDEPDGQVCKLDIKWKGVYDAIPDTKRYQILDLLRTYRLPVVVRVRDFNPSDMIPQVTCSQLKAIRTLDLTLTLEKELTHEYVMGINESSSSSSSSSSNHDAGIPNPPGMNVFVMSKNIDLDFVTSSDMTMNPKKYKEVMDHLGTIGDGLVSMISKDIYLNEYGSPMISAIPFSKLQPKKCIKKSQATASSENDDSPASGKGTPTRQKTANGTYIDLETFTKEAAKVVKKVEQPNRPDEEQEKKLDQSEQYETLHAIMQTLADMAGSKSLSRHPSSTLKVAQCKDLGRSKPQLSLRLDKESEFENDDYGEDYSVLRSPTSVSTPSSPNLRRFDDFVDGDKSHYQVPRALYGSGGEDLFDDTGGLLMGNRFDYKDFSRKRSIRARCPDSLPRMAPPPVPMRPKQRHRSLTRAESTPTILVAPPPKFANPPIPATPSPPEKANINAQAMLNSSSKFRKPTFPFDRNETALPTRVADMLAKRSLEDLTAPVPAQLQYCDRSATLPLRSAGVVPRFNAADDSNIDLPPPPPARPSDLPALSRDLTAAVTDLPSSSRDHSTQITGLPSCDLPRQAPAPPTYSRDSPTLSRGMPSRDLPRPAPDVPTPSRESPSLSRALPTPPPDLPTVSRDSPTPPRSVTSPADILPPPPDDFLPTPLSSDDAFNLDVFPIADFPPPLPSRTPSRSPSLVSLVSLESVDNNSGSGTSLSKSMPCSTFKSELKSVLTKNAKQSPAVPKRESRGSTDIRRSQSYSPTRRRNPEAARRKLPELPEQPSLSSIEFPINETHSLVFKRTRPSSSGNILEDIRPPPPLPPNPRSTSMDNLAVTDEADQRAPLQKPECPPEKPTRERKELTTFMTTTPPRIQRRHPGFSEPHQSTIPVANIAPTPSPTGSMGDSYVMPDGGRKLPVIGGGTLTSSGVHKLRATTAHYSDDEENNYLNPLASGRQGGRHLESSPGRGSHARSTSTPPRTREPHPPKVPARPRPSAVPTPTKPKNLALKTEPSMITCLRDIPNDITTLSCDQVAQSMALLNVRKDIIENFKSCQMNGELLKSMTEEILQAEFKMTTFYAIKVVKFVNGWRP